MNSGIYHIFNRGTEKRRIFMDENDYFKFIHDLFEFNDENNVLNLNRIDVRRQSESVEMRRPRKLLVNILAFCLMPNHYHLILKSCIKDGIPLFIKKLNGGYAKYFNAKYERTGRLFQGKYKSKELNEDLYLTYLPHYVHANALDLLMPEWRDQKISNLKKALEFLRTYRWSSYLDYIGIKNFPSVTQREFLIDYYKPQTYENHFQEWLKSMDINDIKIAVIE